MMNNNNSPLEELRKRKALLRQECAESEDRLAAHWSYLSENAGSLIFQSAVGTVARRFGFGALGLNKQQGNTQNAAEQPLGLFQGLFSGFMSYYPLVWEIAQPILLRYVMKKIRSIFSRKKKKKDD